MISQADLKYFIELSKTLHLTRAAERLALTQPTLSHSLKRLESEIGCELFVRSKKGLKLTAAGEKLQGSASDLLNRWEELKSSALGDVELEQGVIKIGCHTAVAQYIFKEIIPEFLKKYPKIQIQLVHGLSRHMTEQVVSSQIDVAFAVNPVEHPDLIIKEICQDEVCLWKAKGCLNEDVLFVDANLLQSQNILSKLQKKGHFFNRVIESTSLEVISNMVANRAGYGIVPTRVVKQYEESKLEKVKDSPIFNDRICLVYKNEFRKLKRGQIFIEAVKKSMA
jgi:LysR family transcriptional regulator, cell division regulator